MSDLTVWLSRHYDVLKDFAGPVATVIAATAATFVTSRIAANQIALGRLQADIADKNWKVSRDKVMLDLFDRRMSFYDDLRGVISEIMRTGSVAQKTLFEFARATDRTDILFGSDVADYVERLKRLIGVHFEAESIARNPRDETDRLAAIERQSKSFEEIMRFYELFPALIKSYVAMHHRGDQA